MHRLVSLVILSVALVACASDGSGGGDASQVGEPAQISHVHGLGVDSAGTLYVATHYGLIRQGTDGDFVYASADSNDHMGFSLHPGDGIMYRSGHSLSKPSLGVESSTDGARWTHLSDVADPPVDFHAMAVSFADSESLWGWDSGGRGTFRSTDGGKTWTRLEARGVERQIYVLAGTVEANTVLAGTASGMYRSTDGGRTWTAVDGTGGGWVIGIGVDPRNPKRLVVSTQRGMKVTADGGATWKSAGAGIPDGAEIAYVAISPSDGDVAYAADSSAIYQTTDGGKVWTAVSMR
jgi:photosystem II stability/assembly factor-like uncharacterized protein